MSHNHSVKRTIPNLNPILMKNDKIKKKEMQRVFYTYANLQKFYSMSTTSVIYSKLTWFERWSHLTHQTTSPNEFVYPIIVFTGGHMSRLFINYFSSLIIQLAAERQKGGHMEAIDWVLYFTRLLSLNWKEIY